MIQVVDAVSILDAVGARINIVFHDLTEMSNPVSGRYTVPLDSFETIVDWLVRTDIAKRCRLYFDDNHVSFHQLVVGRENLGNFDEVVVAVPAASVGETGSGSWDELDRAQTLGVRIAAHGYQHVRLASYEGDALVETPLGGRYRPAGPDHRPDDVLVENEVLYQLVEAREALDRFAPAEFVLPYGCFNRSTSALNERLGLYANLATADFDLDVGQALRPRLLVEATTTIETLQSAILRRIGEAA